MKVLHYIIRPAVARCHLIFGLMDDPFWEHYYILPARTPNWFLEILKKYGKNFTNDGNYEKTHVMRSKSDNLITFNCLTQFMGQLESIKPDLVLFADAKPEAKIFNHFRSKNPNCKLWIFNHGVWCPGIFQRQAHINNVYANLNVFDKVFFSHSEIENMIAMHKKHNIATSVLVDKLVHVNGYICLDYLQWLVNRKQSERINSGGNNSGGIDVLNQRSKMILFITNKAGFDNKATNANHEMTFNEYKIVIGTLLDFANKYDYRIVAKMKSTGVLENRSSRAHHGMNLSRLKVVGGLELPYDLMIEADIIIIQGYSTTFIESIYLGKWVILIQIPFNSDFLGIHAFPNLVSVGTAYTGEALMKQLVGLHEKIEKHGVLGSKQQTETIGYFNDQKAYLDKYLGSPRELAYDKILTEAKKTF